MSWLPEMRRPLVLIFGLAYIFLYLNRHWLYWPLPSFIGAYLADVLALPVGLTLCLLVLRYGYFRTGQFCLPTSWIISSWLVFSLWFEVILPHLRPAQATADWLDVVAYALGGFIFWRWLNQPVDASGR